MDRIFFLILILTTIACTPNSLSSKLENSHENTTPIAFFEERRLNKKIDFPEVTVVNSLVKLTEIYAQLEEPNFPRSAPIPSFDPSSESILVLKPKMENNSFSDVNVQKISLTKNNEWLVQYAYAPSEEFVQNKWNDPIIILRVSGHPETVKLVKSTE